MEGVKNIDRISMMDELRVCPDCRYERGFHVSFVNRGERKGIVLICPNCGARLDPGFNV